MPNIRSLTCAIAAGLLVQRAAAGFQNNTCPDPDDVCEVHAVNFYNGGTYFQNVNSDANFTFSSQYSGCQDVSAYNILVDPSGTEYLCSNTTLAPDNTTQTSTCPIEKDELTSGDWSVILISNNGACAPVAFQRNFILTVGTPTTSTVTPLVVYTSTSTPITIATTVSTDTIAFYLPTSTVTGTISMKNPTRTIIPRTSTVTTTTTLSTKTLTRYNLLVDAVYKTVTAKCHTPSVAPTPDPPASVSLSTTYNAANGAQATETAAWTPTATSFVTSVITSSSVLIDATSTSIATDPSSTDSGLLDRRDYVDDVLGGILGDLPSFVNQRASKLDAARVVNKRDVDQSVIYVIQTSTESFSYSTSTIYAPTVTTTTTSIVATTSTVKQSTVTLYLNQKTTITKPTPTQTKTRTIKMVTTWATATRYQTAHITTTITPPVKAASCSASGGVMQ